MIKRHECASEQEYRKLYSKQWYQLNKKQLNARSKQYNIDNKEKLALYRKKHYQTNKKQHKAKVKQRNIDNKEKVAKEHKQYYLENKKYLLNYNKKYNKQNKQVLNLYRKNKKLLDPQYKLSSILRTQVCAAIKKQKGKKIHKTFELVGCSVEFLKKHLENQFQLGMTWNNHGEWHVDHIKPCISFDLTNVTEQKQCFHYTNLQPLWAEDNLSKGGKY